MELRLSEVQPTPCVNKKTGLGVTLVWKSSKPKGLLETGEWAELQTWGRTSKTEGKMKSYNMTSLHILLIRLHMPEHLKPSEADANPRGTHLPQKETQGESSFLFILSLN